MQLNNQYNMQLAHIDGYWRNLVNQQT